ncbi:MAG: tRNA 2-thiouridine(34) synthase MnmA [Deltaproteobacteria bacterium]|nr:tRNA 2-thiouridine(34) synthase MnmA [Deltaproteobacteria bacterium]
MPTLDKNRVVVAMSGGVDSSVAALLLKEQGYEVIGISMKTHEEPEGRGEVTSPVQKSKKSCCAVEDIEDARRVASLLDIPFYPFNFKEEFREAVIKYFVHEYGIGRTPNPCVLCNQKLKFSALLTEAKRLGAYHLATGHYVQKVTDNLGRHLLRRAADKEKDQSYFLFNLNQDQLGHLLFPIGSLTKEEVRQRARDSGLMTAEKPESQEICFIPDNKTAVFVKSQLPVYQQKPGSFVSKEGEKIADHDGIHNYTIGQRRGLNVAVGERMYVTEIRPASGEVVLGHSEDLLKTTVFASGITLLTREGVQGTMEVEAKIRYRHSPAKARLTLSDGGLNARIEFEEPQRAVTPGQAIVFYDGEKMLGGGWIEKSA